MIYNNNRRSITVDIDARQSGKTTRLINNIQRWLQYDNNNQVKIVVINDMMRHHLIWLFRHNFHDETLIEKLCDSIFTYNNDRIVTTSQLMIGWSIQPHCKIFVDEFDQMNDIPIVNNSYYCGTIIHNTLSSQHLIDCVLENDDISNNLFIPHQNNEMFYSGTESSVYSHWVTQDKKITSQKVYVEDNDTDSYNERCGIEVES